MDLNVNLDAVPQHQRSDLQNVSQEYKLQPRQLQLLNDLFGVVKTIDDLELEDSRHQDARLARTLEQAREKLQGMQSELSKNGDSIVLQAYEKLQNLNEENRHTYE